MGHGYTRPDISQAVSMVSRHMHDPDIGLVFVWDYIENEKMILQKIGTEDNPADMLTSVVTRVPRLMDKEGLPLNKGKVFISKTSPAALKEEYLAQFEEDFSLFLKSRSHEMIREGRVILIINGRLSEDPTNGEPWEPLAEAIADMVSLGVIPEEKLDSFNVPYYIPSEKEVKNIVDREGSFELEVLETFPIEMGDKSVWSSDEKFIKNLRSFTESMVSHHFGEEILDKLYDKFAQIVLQDLATRTEPSEVISFVVVLRRL
ncbi:probable caffeine synthase 2 [Pistacia vera]|uniref:probable caffeine synthase 2 n=1 Tax=Pistacia vera TaxID=55513 RepID=UPI0012633139|nr:probable caffeine synthase 2 [Pistacia vera]